MPVTGVQTCALPISVAIAAAAGSVSQAQEKPMPPPAAENTLPPSIAPNSLLAQIIKLVQAGVDASVIKNFVSNATTAFGLDADQIIALNDAGVPVEIINVILSRDKILYAASVVRPAVSAPAPVVQETPPPAPVTVNYFNDSLSPYGSWVEVDGYGRCWRPTVVNYDSGWRPYSDRGHWVYTDYGWYWDSDYSWGVTFHYGRWFRNSRFGWCWYPDTEWAPSWVTWRSSDDYRGWAPLPPLAVYREGVGFCYRGANVSVDFDFGLGADCFTFVAPGHFCDHHPRRWCPEPEHVTQIFNHTTIINNYNIHNTTVVNNGIAVTQVNGAGHRPIQPVTVDSLPNAGRQGWRGNDGDHPTRHDTADKRDGHPVRPLPVMRPGSFVSAGQPTTTVPSGPREPSDRGNLGNGSRGDRSPRPSSPSRSTENNDSVRRQNNDAAQQSASGSVFISRPVTAAGVVDTGRNRNERPAPENRWRSGGDNRSATAPPTHGAPAVNSQTAPTVESRQPVISAGNRGHALGDDRSDRSENGNRFRNAPEPSQPHYTAPVEHAAPAVEQRPFTAMSAPERSQPRERPVERPAEPRVEQSRAEQRAEQHQSRVETVQHSAPAPSQSHDSERSSSHNSDHNSDSKDKKDR